GLAEAPTMTRKWGQNGSKRRQNGGKPAPNHGSFGQNEAVFCRNSHDAKRLPLWPLPGVFKLIPTKELRPILAGRSRLICRNRLSTQELRKVRILEKPRMYYEL